MMFCSKCGTELRDDSQFCRKCGYALGTASADSGAAVAPAPAEPKLVATELKPKSVRAPFVVAAVLVALFIFFVVLANLSSTSNRNASTIDQFVKQQHTQNISNPALAVNATGYSYFKLTVPPGATSVHFQGNFSASGGSGNDIEAFVLPETDFVNWQNGHSAKSFYNSGKVTISTINANLPSDEGTYYLVFSNREGL
jgi:zinc ribbon protein